MSFACLECRKAFKRHVPFGHEPEELPCPQCGSRAFNLGRNFTPPRHADFHQWEKIRFLVEQGFRFLKIRIGPAHHDTVPYPETLAEAKEFVVEYKQYARTPMRNETNT